MNCSFQYLDNFFMASSFSFQANKLEIRLIKRSLYLVKRRLLMEMFAFIVRKRIEIRLPSDSKTGFSV